ncbi:unnamed protein product, partial [Laminaria digitata]
METRLHGVRRRLLVHRLASTLLYVLLLSSVGGRKSLISAQSECSETRTEPILVEDALGVAALQVAVNCTDGGTVHADWAGRVPVGTPIVVASGTSLSVTGADTEAEAYASGVTRLFEVARGGGLTLTGMKLSGGSAEEGGAISSSQANLTMDNCTVEGNVATTGNGGAVWANGGNLTIVGGQFLSNIATRYGGAVLTIDATLVVQSGASFHDNEAIVGSALFCEGSEAAEITSGVLCSLSNAVFTSNNAAGEDTGDEKIEDLGGGGAAAFLNAKVGVTDSVFSGNFARIAGGALYGGDNTFIEVNGCTFEDNTSQLYGGAISASSMTLDGGTMITNNAVSKSAGAVLGWDSAGTITFNNVTCSDNSAVSEGGCYYGRGTTVINDGTVMHDNSALDGGCLFSAIGGDVRVDGGDFMCRVDQRGGFLYIEEFSVVTITEGLFANNMATRRAGAIYCSGANGGGGSKLNVEGGVFVNNTALELGGAITAWGDTTVVNITGGLFTNNTAKFYGGFVFLEEEASLKCENATVTDNYAGDQGGGIYAREATWVNSSCNVVSSESPQGAAIYLTNVMSATFENHRVADNLASGGSVMFVAKSSVVARGVTFESRVGLQEDSSNRAIQLDGGSTLHAEGCTFNGWLGDAVIYHINSANSSLVLDSCDFGGSAATMAVISPHSDAEIRNAVVSSFTFENAVPGTMNNSLTLVDRALVCSDPNACGDGKCVDSTLGVLCECLEGGECLDDGGELSLSLETPPANVTYGSNAVSYELLVSSAATGTTYAIWNLEVEAEHLDLDVVPSSGVLPPGSKVTVSVTGTATKEDVGGDLVSSFVVTSVGSNGSDSTAGGVELDVYSTYYLCRAYEFAEPRDDVGNDEDEALFKCEQCATIIGEEGVDCGTPGATRASLPIKEGFWRESRESLTVHACLHSDACTGATVVSSSDDYCQEGYKGPYCAVCTEGYGKGVSNTCHSCDDSTAHLLITMGVIFSLVAVVVLLLAVVFLIGGLDAIAIVRQTVTRKIPFASNSSSTGIPVPGPGSHGRKLPQLGPRNDSLEATVAPAYGMVPKLARGGEGATSHDRMFQSRYSGSSEAETTYDRRFSADAGVGEIPARQQPARLSAVADAHVAGAQVFRGEAVEGDESAKPKCCGLGDKVKRMMSRLPLNKLKILVVVWQILAVFSSITGVEFPASYARFLSWISVVNLDLGNIFSASCVLHSITFYVSLLVTTLSPLALAGVLVLTYHMAKHRSGIGSAGMIARRAAWSRHVAAGLLLTFLVFTSTSTAVFKTFACDEDAVTGESYLRADYSLSCRTDLHMFFQVYAGLMIAVYPVGIPALYATILWKNRDLLNPRIYTDGNTPTGVARADSGSRDDKPATLQELEEKVQARRENPELVPSMFLWKDFGPDLYYYEVIECGRRILLTGVLIFISPSSATQAAMACIFAFGSLLGFELMRPHLDPADVWLYRLGCVIIFLSNFLALLIKVDAGEEGNHDVFGALLVVINVMLVLAVLVTSWFATQQSVDDHRDEENSLTLAKAMLTAEQHAATSARLQRSGKAPMSSASSAVLRPGLPRSDPRLVWRGPTKTHRRQRSGATARSEEPLPSLAHDGT